MRAPPQWPACAYLSPFTCVLRIEPLEHIMRAPVAAQDRDWVRAVAKMPHLIPCVCQNLLFLPVLSYVSIRPFWRSVARIRSIVDRACVSAVVPPEGETMAAARGLTVRDELPPPMTRAVTSVPILVIGSGID